MKKLEVVQEAVRAGKVNDLRNIQWMLSSTMARGRSEQDNPPQQEMGEEATDQPTPQPHRW